MAEIPEYVWSLKSQKGKFIATSNPAIPQSEYHQMLVCKSKGKAASPGVFQRFPVKCEQGTEVGEEGQEISLNSNQAEWAVGASVKLENNFGQDLDHAVKAEQDRDIQQTDWVHMMKLELNSSCISPVAKTEQDYMHNCILVPKQEQGVSHPVENDNAPYKCSASSVNIVKCKMNSRDITCTKTEPSLVHSENTEQSNVTVIAFAHSDQDGSTVVKTEQKEICCQHRACSLKTEGMLEQQDEQPKSHQVTEFYVLGWTGCDSLCSDLASGTEQKVSTSPCGRAAGLKLSPGREGSTWQQTRDVLGSRLSVAIPDRELHKNQDGSSVAAVPDVSTNQEIRQAGRNTESPKHSDRSPLKTDIAVDSEVTFAKPFPLKKHTKIHRSSRHYQGTRSNSVFQQTSDTEKHMTPSKVTIHQYNMWMTSCRKSVDLQRHKLTHTDVKSHQCGICKLAFRTSSYLRKHMSLHSVATIRQSTARKAAAKTSLRRTASRGDAKCHECRVCKAVFKTLSHLNRHTTTHSDVRVHQCSTCRAAFRTSSDLREHMVIHSDVKAYQCDVCSAAFKRSKHLTQHMLVHSDAREQQCSVCKAAFRRASDLKRHVVIHDDLRPYQCSVCKADFKRSSHLKRHAVTHSDSNPYRCRVCDASFKRLANLRKHVLIHK